MKDFSWKYFALTGDVESYLLYKDIYNQDVSLPAEILITGDIEEEMVLDQGSV